MCRNFWDTLHCVCVSKSLKWKSYDLCGIKPLISYPLSSSDLVLVSELYVYIISLVAWTLVFGIDLILSVTWLLSNVGNIVFIVHVAFRGDVHCWSVTYWQLRYIQSGTIIFEEVAFKFCFDVLLIPSVLVVGLQCLQYFHNPCE